MFSEDFFKNIILWSPRGVRRLTPYRLRKQLISTCWQPCDHLLLYCFVKMVGWMGRWSDWTDGQVNTHAVPLSGMPFPFHSTFHLINSYLHVSSQTKHCFLKEAFPPSVDAYEDSLYGIWRIHLSIPKE